MHVEVVTHLSDCFGGWSLVFDGDLCQPCVDIKFDVVPIENVFVFVVYFHVFVAFYTLELFACQSLFLLHLDFSQFLVDPIRSYFASICRFLFLLWRQRGFRRRWGRSSSSFDIVRREESFFITFFDDITVPPSGFVRMFNKYFITFAERKIVDFLFLLLLLIIFIPSLFFELFILLLISFSFSFVELF